MSHIGRVGVNKPERWCFCAESAYIRVLREPDR
jgi:hypothetical protein